MTESITTGQTKIYSVNVGVGASFLEADLIWENTSDKLTLNVYTPSGDNLSYNEESDGCINGRIHVSISPSDGPMQLGTWQFEIHGEYVSGSEGYTFNIYQHET